MTSTYTLSPPILEKIGSRSNAKGLPWRTSTRESDTAYIDRSLALLGSAILGQDQQLDIAFKQQSNFVRDANLDAYRSQIERDGTIIEKLNDFDRDYSKCFHEIEERLQQIDNTMKELAAQCASVAVVDARQRNLTKVRPHHIIERVPHIKHGIAYWADEETHPKTVKDFWRMAHQSEQRRNLIRLLQFYDVRTLCVPPANAVPNFHNDDEDEDELDTTAAVFRNQKACAEVLASHLGVDFARMEDEAEKLTDYKRRANFLHREPERRRQEDEPEEDRPRTRIKTQADKDGRIQTQVRAMQEQSSGTSVTSPRSNASAPHLGRCPSSSPSGISDSLATQRLSRDSDGDL